MQSFSNHLDGWHDVADQLRDDLRRRAREALAARVEQKKSWQTVTEFEAARDSLRQHFLCAIGGLPAEKTPLNARVTGTIEEENFTIEKILFESLPNYLVSAACYRPKYLQENQNAKAPAVIFVHGHSDLGKAHPRYQMVCRALAQAGIMALAIDPIGQGERFQYLDENSERLTPGCTVEHSHAGFPFVLMGASVARHFVWDIMRAVDYLEARGDVDAARIGITGNSGGGTQTCLAMMLEPRLAAAMPGTFVMTLETMMKTGHPQDMEQIVYGAMKHGPDHDDFLCAMAPRPVRVGAVAYDTFPLEGAQEATRRAKEIYALYDKSENVDIVVDLSHHEYSDGLRAAAVEFFSRHFQPENGADFPSSATMEVLEEEQLNVTQSGQILRDYPQSRTIADLIEDYLDELPAAPNAPPEMLRVQLDATLGVSQGGERNAPIYPRLARSITDFENGSWEKLWFFSAPDIAVSGLLFHPPHSADKVLATTILLLPEGTNQIESEMPRIEKLLQQNRRVFVFDVRGTGGVAPRSLGSAYDRAPFFGIFNTIYKFSCEAMMLELSLLGLRVFDVLRAFDYLQSRADVGKTDLHGVGTIAPVAFFAAALEPQIAALACEDMLYSYRDLCRTKNYDRQHHPLAILPWGILRVGDFRDLLPCFDARAATFIAPHNAAGEAVPEADFVAEFSTGNVKFVA